MAYMSPKTFTTLILGLAVRFPLTVTSWIRSPVRNKAVGGTFDSLHQYGLAVDVVLDDPDQKPHFLRACERLGLKAIDEGDHIHIQIP